MRLGAADGPVRERIASMLFLNRFQILRDLCRARNGVDGWRSQDRRVDFLPGAVGAKLIWFVICVML